MAEKLKVNIVNHGTNKICQNTDLDVTNRIIGDEHILKESSHTTEDKKKVTLIWTLTRPSLNIMNTFRLKIELRNMKNLIRISLSKSNLKKYLSFSKICNKSKRNGM